MSLRIKGFAGLLLALMVAQAVLAMRTKSPTADEFSHHVASAYSSLVTRGDFRLIPISPPLPRILSAIPLLWLGAKAPLDHPSWQAGDSPEFARQFFYHANTNADQLIFWARVPIVMVSVVFAFSVFLFAGELFGAWAGLASLALYVFCPDMLAHSGLATADLTVAFFFFLTLVSFRRYLTAPTRKNLILTGLASGAAFLSKFSAVLLFPTLLIVAAVSGKLKEVAPRKTFLFLLVCFLTVWAGYFFEVRPLLKNTPHPEKKAEFLQKIGGPRLVSFARETPVPLSTFAASFAGMVLTRAQGTNAYLLGRWSKEGRWYYYLVAFAVKNTIPLILLCLLSFVLMKKLGLDSVTLATLYVPAAFFFVATLGDKAQAGIRYFLPVYPFFFVLGGGTLAYLWRKGRLLKFIVAGLLIWHAGEALFIFPDYLAYFNEAVGGPRNGYKVLRDSNLDWGQDLKGLGIFVRAKKYPEVVLFFHDGADPAYYGIPARKPRPEEFAVPGNTVYAVGAHFLDAFEWTKTAIPTKVIGYSVFVYDFRR